MFQWGLEGPTELQFLLAYCIQLIYRLTICGQDLDTKWHDVAIKLKHGDEKSKITKEEQDLLENSSHSKMVYNRNLVSIEKRFFLLVMNLRSRAYKIYLKKNNGLTKVKVFIKCYKSEKKNTKR